MKADPETRLAELDKQLELLNQSKEALRNSDGDVTGLGEKLAATAAQISIVETRREKALAELRDLRVRQIDKELDDLRIEDERLGKLLAEHAAEVMDIMSEWFGKPAAQLLRHPGKYHGALDEASNHKTRRTTLEEKLQPEREAVVKKAAALRIEKEALNVPKSEPVPATV